MRILGISGSLRADSHNGRLLDAAGREMPEGVRFEVWDGLRDVPPYDEDLDTPEPPAEVTRLREAFARADAILIATPEYNSSIPGSLKNAIDWASRPRAESPLRFKPVAVMGATTGAFGAVWAQAELRKVLGSAGARVVEGEVALAHAHEGFAEDGSLKEEGLQQQLHDLVELLVDEASPERVAA
ncbi:MAG: NADPH-dependent FMN reductase [Thermoleophilia bacterium]